MDLAHPFSTFGTNVIHHLIFPQRKSKAYQCVKKKKKTNSGNKVKFLHLEIHFPLKDLHSMAEAPRVNLVKTTLIKEAQVCVECQNCGFQILE